MQSHYYAGLPVYPSQEAHESELQWDSERLSTLIQLLVEEKRVWQRSLRSAEDHDNPPSALEGVLVEIYKILSMIRAYFRNRMAPPPEYLLQHWADNMDLFEKLSEVCPSSSSQAHDNNTSFGSIDALIGTTGDLSRALLRVMRLYRVRSNGE